METLAARNNELGAENERLKKEVGEVNKKAEEEKKNVQKMEKEKSALQGNIDGRNEEVSVFSV